VGHQSSKVAMKRQMKERERANLPCFQNSRGEGSRSRDRRTEKEIPENLCTKIFGEGCLGN